MKENASVLVIGEHNVGKTNYAMQLFGRLRSNNNSGLRLLRTPATIAPFELGLSALNNGRTPAHTPSTANDELELNIEFNERQVSLTWPDYGGEQISEILQSRSLSEAWQNRIANADAWMLFLRLSTIGDSLDAIAHPAPTGKSNAKTELMKIDETGTAKPWNSNAKIIELLQMLLHEKRIGIHDRVKSPALVVALSCWDELNTQERDKPPAILKQHLPLLSEFLTTRWETDHLSIVGISPLGMAIAENTVNETLRDEGPEQHGFAILPDGKKTSDLSQPILWLMERLS
jgi:GTPase SAR1 family protein